jgi:hypothetical protein
MNKNFNLISIFTLLLATLMGCTFKKSYNGKFVTPGLAKYNKKIQVRHSSNLIPYGAGTLKVVSISGTESSTAVGFGETNFEVLIEMTNPAGAKPLETEKLVVAMKFMNGQYNCGVSGPYVLGEVWVKNPYHSLRPGATGTFRTFTRCPGIKIFQKPVHLQIAGQSVVISKT